MSPQDPRPPRRHVTTSPGGYGALPPRINDGRYDLLAQKLKREEEQQEAERSLSPPPSSAVPAVPLVYPEPRTSFRPGRDSLRAVAESVLRHAPRAAIGIALVVGVTVWALGGPDGLAKLLAAAKSSAAEDKYSALVARVALLETRAGRCEATFNAWRENEIAFRADNAQALERLGLLWPLPDGTPPQRPLKFLVPNRKPGVVNKGPVAVVMQPVPLPPAVPSAAP